MVIEYSDLYSVSSVTFFANPRTAVHNQLPELAQTHVHRVGDAIQPSNPLSSPSPPAFDLAHIRVFSSELTLHIRWPKYWSFSFSISSYNGYSGLISFRNDWFEILAVQRTLKSLLQHFSLKALPGTIPGTVDTSGNKRDPNLALAACILNI